MQGDQYASPGFYSRPVVYNDPRSERVGWSTALLIVAITLSLGGAVASGFGVLKETRRCRGVKVVVHEYPYYYGYDSPTYYHYGSSSIPVYGLPGTSPGSTYTYDTPSEWPRSTFGSTWDDDWMGNKDEYEDVEGDHASSNDLTVTVCKRRRVLGTTSIPAALQVVLVIALFVVWAIDTFAKFRAVMWLFVFPIIGSLAVLVYYISDGVLDPLIMAGFGGIIVGDILLCLWASVYRPKLTPLDGHGAKHPPMSEDGTVSPGVKERAVDAVR